MCVFININININIILNPMFKAMLFMMSQWVRVSIQDIFTEETKFKTL